MFIYYFEVEVDNENSERGLITSENFSNALEKLVEYYGEEIITDIHMRIISGGELIFIPDEYQGIVKSIEQNTVW